jgi:GTP pyrophosphokinase
VVNRNIVPLKYKLQNGDTVEIITRQGHHPNRDWLRYAVTSRAISKIRNWVKTEEQKMSISLGRDILEKEFKKHNLNLNQIVKTDEFKKICEGYSVTSLDDLAAFVGYGKVSVRHISGRFLPEKRRRFLDIVSKKLRRKPATPLSRGVSITGIDDVMVRFAGCCDPLPGDSIIGYISRGRGVTVHTANCSMIKDMEPARLVDVQWNLKEKHTYPVHIRINCKDKRGLLAEITSVMLAKDVNINRAEIDTTPEKSAICNLEIEVNDLKHFKEVVYELKKLKSVLSVERIKRTTPDPVEKEALG